MFSQISWSNYLIVVGIIIVLYYLFVGIKFYWNELLTFFSSNIKRVPGAIGADKLDELQRSSTPQTNPYSFETSRNNYPSPEVVEDTFTQIEELTSKLKQVICNAASDNVGKEDLILSLQLLLKKYNYLKHSPFFVAINNLITSECDKYNSLHLNAEECNMLWR